MFSTLLKINISWAQNQHIKKTFSFAITEIEYILKVCFRRFWLYYQNSVDLTESVLEKVREPGFDSGHS